MQKNIIVFFLFFSTFSFASIDHIGKWVMLTDQNRISAMTSSPTGGILNFSCLPNDDLLLELYSSYAPNSEQDSVQVGIDNFYSFWNYQGNDVVSTDKGAFIIDKLKDKKEISVKLFYNQKPITQYTFNIEGIDQMAGELKIACAKSLNDN